MKQTRFLVPVIAAHLVAALPAFAGPLDADATSEITNSGLPIPRFVSLGHDTVNMRKGPSERYPVIWVYKRESLPLEVVAEYADWRKVREEDGTEGWIKANQLSDQRTALVTRGTRTLYSGPDSDAKPVWKVAKGVIARIKLCEEAWCQVDIEHKTGWILRDQIWGTYPGENFN